MKIFAASAGGLRPKDTRGHFFLPEEGGFGAFSVSSARGFLCGRSALKYKRENRNFLYQTFLFRFLGFCLQYNCDMPGDQSTHNSEQSDSEQIQHAGPRSPSLWLVPKPLE